MLSLLALQGCIWIEDTTDLRAFVADRSSRPVGEIPPLPEFKPYEAFVYEGSSLRNPFRAMVPEVAVAPEIVSEVFPDPDRIPEYLERYAVDNLSMVGTITSPLNADQFFALVRDPLGEVHRVQMGDFLGLDSGQVVGLDERRIELSEIVSNGRGGWMKRPRFITLPETD
ncbi:MAG: pilus assembly protein PilP [Nitrincola sp.]|nr:pilus assembly protein PilP [Nitrincola sp.]